MPFTRLFLPTAYALLHFDHHTGWHFGVQFALLLLIFGSTVQRAGEKLERGVG